MNLELSEMRGVVAELTEQLGRLSAQLKLITAQSPTPHREKTPWLPLAEAAELLRFPSARALKSRILRGAFPPDCYRQIPSPTGKRNTYLVHVDRYLKSLR